MDENWDIKHLIENSVWQEKGWLGLMGNPRLKSFILVFSCLREFRLILEAPPNQKFSNSSVQVDILAEEYFNQEGFKHFDVFKTEIFSSQDFCPFPLSNLRLLLVQTKNKVKLLQLAPRNPIHHF